MTFHSHLTGSNLRDTASILSLILRLTSMLADRTEEWSSDNGGALELDPELVPYDPDDEHRDLVAAAIGRAFDLKRRILDAGVWQVLAAPGADWELACLMEDAHARLGVLADQGDGAARCAHDVLASFTGRLRSLAMMIAEYEDGGGTLDPATFDGMAFEEAMSGSRTLDGQPSSANAHDGTLLSSPGPRGTGTVGEGRVVSERDTSLDASGSPIAPVRRDAFRVQLVSDLHVDVAPYRPVIAPDLDAIVVAGDVRSDPDRAVRWVEEAYGKVGVPVLYVLGNHEFYRHDWDRTIVDARQRARIGPVGEGGMVTVLENDVMHVHGRAHAPPGTLRILACTLWTDLRVHGPAEHDEAMARGEHLMNDFVTIRKDGHTLTPADTVERYVRSRDFLAAQLADPHEGPTLVVTHHAPHPRSLDPRFRDDGTDAFFASDLSSLIATHGPDVWAHGHVHQRVDYQIARTRIVSNPRGYPGEGSGHDPALVIELPVRGHAVGSGDDNDVPNPNVEGDRS